MYYVYVLQSLKDRRLYTGFSEDMNRRFAEHSSGAVNATKHRLPVKLVYYEASCNQQDALHREKYLKTAWGKRYLKSRMKHYLTGRGEAATTEIARNRDAQGFPQNQEAAHDGGNVASNARRDLEKKSGRKVVTRENYLALTHAAEKARRLSK
jgi:putative endonuclease